MFGLDFVIKVVVISASGALAPGPLTASAVAIGSSKGWRGGFDEAVGHMVVEFPLVMAIAYGLGPLLTTKSAQVALGIVGGAFLLYFSYLTALSALGRGTLIDGPAASSPSQPLFTGMALTLFNPYFIAWWVGVGTPLIVQATEYGLLGIALFYMAHVWLDYAWLTLMSSIGSMSRVKIIVYRVILAALAAMLVYYGVYMVLSSLRMLNA